MKFRKKITHSFCYLDQCRFVQLGLNEADTLESSSILIYLSLEQRLYKHEGAARCHGD